MRGEIPRFRHRGGHEDVVTGPIMSVSIVRPLRAAISLTPRDGNVNNAVRLLSLNRLSTARAAKIRLERILTLRTLVLHLERVGTITVPVEDGLGDEISYNRLVENLC